jgi:hypothetical protein
VPAPPVHEDGSGVPSGSRAPVSTTEGDSEGTGDGEGDSSAFGPVHAPASKPTASTSRIDRIGAQRGTYTSRTRSREDRLQFAPEPPQLGEEPLVERGAQVTDTG